MNKPVVKSLANIRCAEVNHRFSNNWEFSCISTTAFFSGWNAALEEANKLSNTDFSKLKDTKVELTEQQIDLLNQYQDSRDLIIKLKNILKSDITDSKKWIEIHKLTTGE